MSQYTTVRYLNGTLTLHVHRTEILIETKVHGNASADNTSSNAARCLYAFGAPDSVRVYPGATKPLIRPTRHDPEIHGADGLGGVEGLPSVENPGVRAHLQAQGQTVRAIEGIARAIETTWRDGNGHQIVLVSSGPMTNIALFVSVYQDLLMGIGQLCSLRICRGPNMTAYEIRRDCFHGWRSWLG